MWKERLKRVLIIAGVAGLVVILVASFVGWQEKKKVAGESIGLPIGPVVQKIDEFGEDILGKAVEVLPGNKEAEEKIQAEEKKEGKTKQIETTKILETQTKEIIEVLKQLPEEQLKQIRKQIFKDFCQEVMGD